MSYSGNVDVIFLGHGEIFAEIAKNVSDLNALAHTKTSYWIDVANSFFGSSVKVIDADLGKTRTITIDQALREMQEPVVVASLEDLTDQTTYGYEEIERWATYVETVLPGRSSRVRVVLPRVPAAEEQPKECSGWLTVALAPEDSDSPRAAIEPVERSDDPFRTAEVFAPGVLGVFGLWKSSSQVAVLGENGKPIDNATTEIFRLVRSYYRSLDASGIENRLFKEVINVKNHIPRTNFTKGNQTDYCTDMADLNGRRTEQLFTRHKENLFTREAPYKQQERIRQNAWAALKMFLKEYFQMFGSPNVWTAQLRGSFNEQVASSIKNTLYGKDSNVDVVIGAQTGKVSINDLYENSVQATGSTQSKANQEADANRLSSLWSDYIDVALTLVDGSERVREISDSDSAKSPKVARRTNQVVPELEDSFDANVPVLRTLLGEDKSELTIAPFDVFRVEAFEKELEYAVARGTGAQTTQLGKNFEEWKAEMSQSFAWNVGQKLSQMIEEARERVRRYRQMEKEKEELLNSLTPRDYDAENKKLCGKLYGIVGFQFLLAVLTIYCTVRYYKPELRYFLTGWSGFDWRWCALLLFVIIFGGLLLSMLTFARVRRGIKDEIEKKKLAEANATIAAANCHAAVSDVRRLSGAYLQFLSWSTLLGKALAHPFGHVTDEAEQADIPTSGLPHSVKIGRVSLSDDAFKTLSVQLRNQLYEEDWAGDAWKNYVEQISAKLRESDGCKVERIGALHGLAGSGSDSTLDKLAQIAKETSLEATEEAEKKRASVLSSADKVISDRGLSSVVEYFERGKKYLTSRAEFLEDFEGAKSSLMSFNGAAVAPKAVTDRLTNVSPELSVFDDNGGKQSRLTKAVCWVQFSEPAMLSYLAHTANKEVEQPEFTMDDEVADSGFSAPIAQSDTAEFDEFGSI